MDKLMREEFEAWCKTYHHATMEFGEYTSDYTDFAWKAWQAADAARNKHRVVVAETVSDEGTPITLYASHTKNSLPPELKEFVDELDKIQPGDWQAEVHAKQSEDK